MQKTDYCEWQERSECVFTREAHNTKKKRTTRALVLFHVDLLVVRGILIQMDHFLNDMKNRVEHQKRNQFGL